SHAGTVSVSPTSAGVSGTWMGVVLTASNTGGIVSLAATANADLSQTPSSIYIQNEAGQQIGQPCNASTCSASITVGANDSLRYRAVIGRIVRDQAVSEPLGSVLNTVPAKTSHLDLQAASALVRPTRLLWGVDSCKAYTSDPAGRDGLRAQANGIIGTPDFWGRYLPNTANGPALSATEISAAAAPRMGSRPT